MKYIDGIKETGGNKAVNLIIRVFKTGKHIDIIYYKSVTIGYLDNTDNLKWIDGQPYELIVLGKD